MLKKVSKIVAAVLLVAISSIWTGCSDDDELACGTPNLSVNSAQLQADIDIIESYLTDNNINAEIHESGVRYVINNAGTGTTPTLCNSVGVTYRGMLMSNGAVFDEASTPRVFPLSRLITGWQIGIPLIKSGGSITLYIPSVYGYGSTGAGSDIPPNANLIFTVGLASVQ